MPNSGYSVGVSMCMGLYMWSKFLTALQVIGRPALSFSSGSTIPNCIASSRFGSEMIGYGNLSPKPL